MAKLKYEDVKEYIESFGYKLLSKEYIGHNHKMDIQCPKGHVYKSSNTYFKMGKRCPKCQTLNKRLPDEEIKKSVNDAGYSLNSIIRKNHRTYIDVICDKGHRYTTDLSCFKSGRRCRTCSGSQKKTYEYVYEYFYNEGYTLLSSEYHNNKEKLMIECPKGHEFKMKFNHFSTGTRCPFCKESKGERIIEKYLIKNNIKYVRQHRFDDCKYERKLPFDFYIPSLNTLIEYDGELHYKSVDYFGGDDHYNKTLIRDKIKDSYCKNNNIKLIRIPYWELNNVESILNNNLNIENILE